jgi:hypothetical protein
VYPSHYVTLFASLVTSDVGTVKDWFILLGSCVPTLPYYLVIIPPVIGSPFCRLIRLAGLRWRYSKPPPHGIANHQLMNLAFIRNLFTTNDCYHNLLFTKHPAKYHQAVRAYWSLYIPPVLTFNHKIVPTTRVSISCV